MTKPKEILESEKIYVMKKRGASWRGLYNTYSEMNG